MAGRLEGLELPLLIRDLHRRHATGRLHVERHGVHRTVFLDAGRVQFAASTNPNDRLGEHLLRMGKISVGQLEETLAQSGNRSGIGKRLGMLMVEAGIFSSEDLIEFVKDQVRSVVLDLLTWTEGDYNFEEGPVPDEDITLDMSTEELLFRGVRQVRSSRLIERAVGTPRTVFRLCDNWAKCTGTVDLNEGAQLLVDRLAEGPTSVGTLCREVSVSSFSIQQTLWAFRLLGVAEPCGRRRNDDREGSLRDVGLAELLIHHESSGETGVLYVSHSSVERSILFAAGRCVFATSNDPDDGLINFLFRRGVISLRDKEETVRRLLSNKRVGTILRELGAIDDADLQSMVRQQVSEIIYDTFTWEDGDFVFVPSSLPSAEEITLNCGVHSLIAEGIRRVRSWTRLVQGCGGVDNPLCLTPRYLEVLDDIDAGVAEWDVINALKSPQTARRVCALSELDDFRACQILWTLKILGAVEDSPIDVCETDVEAPVDVEPAEAEAINVVEEEYAAHGEIDSAPTAPHSADEAPVPPYPDTVQRQEIEQALRSVDDDVHTPTSDAALQSDAPLDEPAIGLPLSEMDADEAAAADPDADVEPVQEEFDLPPEFEDVIDRFNAMHRLVFRAVRSEVGAGAANFVRTCCIEVAREVRDPVEGVRLHADGSWDVNGLKKVIVEKGIDDPWTAYRCVLDQEFVSLEPHLSETRADELKREILDIEQDSVQHP
jgi:hypothetical protein